MFGFAGIITNKNGVHLKGIATRQNLLASATPSMPGLVAIGAGAQLRNGDWAGSAAPGGISNLYVDGNFIGGDSTVLAKKGLVRHAGVNMFVNNLFVVRSAGDNQVYDGVQNSTIIGGASTFAKGRALALDNGCGALAFQGGYYGTSKQGVLDCIDTPGETNLYPFGPTQITFDGTIFEAYPAQASPLDEPFSKHIHISGTSIKFNNCNFTGGAENDVDCVVLIDSTCTSFIPPTVTFDNCFWWVHQAHDAIRVVGNAVLFIDGQQSIGDDGTHHAVSFMAIDGGSPHVAVAGEIIQSGDVNGSNMFRTLNSGTLNGLSRTNEGGVIYRLRTNGSLGVRRPGDTTNRAYLNDDGVLAWTSGASAVTQAYIRRLANGIEMYTAGDPYVLKGGDLRVDGAIYSGGVLVGTGGGGTSAGIADQLALRAYGNSYLAGTGNALSIYFNRARRILQSKSWDNRGVSGYLVNDVNWVAYDNISDIHQGTLADEELAVTGPMTQTPAVFQGGMFLLDTIRNDAGHDGQTVNSGSTAKSRAGAKIGLDALIRLIRAGSYKLATDASYTYSGTWLANAALPGVLGHSVKYTQTNGASVSIAFTGTDFDLVLLGLDDAALGVVGSTFSITVDGASQDSALAAAGYPNTCSNQMRRTKAAGPVKYGPMVIPLHGLSAGAHTIVVTHTGTTGQALYVNGHLVPSPTPPTVIVSKVNYLGSAGYATYVALGGAGAATSVDDVYNGIIDTVLARFPSDGSIQVIDPNALGFNPATMIGNTDGLNVHLNDTGNHFYAMNLVNKIRNLSARNGLTRT